MRRRRDEGQATVELALVLPVVALLGLAILQLALIGRAEVMTVHAAREAARVIAVGEPDAAARAAAAAAGRMAPQRLEVTVSRDGRDATVRVRYTQRTDVPFVGALIDDVVHEASATMRIER